MTAKTSLVGEPVRFYNGFAFQDGVVVKDHGNGWVDCATNEKSVSTYRYRWADVRIVYPDGTPLAPGDSLDDNPQGGTWEPKNHNCLAGLQCNKCGSEGPFRIESKCVADWTDDGTDNAAQFSFDDASYAECIECTGYGTVAALLKPKCCCPLVWDGSATEPTPDPKRVDPACPVHSTKEG